jgi:hypothetical protein
LESASSEGLDTFHL